MCHIFSPPHKSLSCNINEIPRTYSHLAQNEKLQSRTRTILGFWVVFHIGAVFIFGFTMIYPTSGQTYLEVSWNGGTSKSSIFNGIVHVKPSSYWGTPICGNSHLRATYRPETPQRIMHSLPPHGAHVRRTGEIDTDGAIARLLDASCTVGSTIYSLRWIIVIMFYLFIYIYMNIMYTSCYRRKFWNQTSDNMYRWSSRGGNSFYVAPRCFRCFSLRLSPFR